LFHQLEYVGSISTCLLKNRVLSSGERPYLCFTTVSPGSAIDSDSKRVAPVIKETNDEN
jgi:hypothetical protein